MIEKFDAFHDTQNGIDNQQLTHCFMSARALVKLNDLVDTINRLEESVQGVVNNSINDGGRIQGLKEKLDAVVNMVNIHEGEIDKLQMKVEPEKLSQFVNAADLEKQDDPETRPENVWELVTLTDMFNEMGRLYADLWNKLEDIHNELKGGKDE